MEVLHMGRIPVLLLGCASLFSVSAHAADYCTDSPVDGAAYKVVNVGSNLLLNVENGSLSSGANINTIANNGQNSQRFYAQYQASSHYWVLKAAHTGQLVDVAGDSFYNGGNVVQASLAGDKSQEWELKQQSDGSYRIVNRNSSYSLTVAGANSGANVYQNADAAASSQRWWLDPVSVSCGSDSGSSDTPPSTGEGSFKLSGFASISGDDGLSSTTGGAGGSTVTVNSCSELKSALSSSSAKIIQVPDNTTIDCTTSGTPVSVCVVPCPDYQDPNKNTYRIPTSNVDCSDLGASSTTTKYRHDTQINVTSHKTLVGLGAGSAIEGASLYIKNAKNVIIRNLAMSNVNPELVEGGDAITLQNASHVVVDHVAFSLISDGHVDIKDSKNVTLSYNHFDGYNNYVCANQHWYTNYVVNSEVSFSHNFWDYTAGRNPKLYGSATRGHLYNNYWHEVTYFSVGVDNGAQALMQGNYFNDSARPHWNLGSGAIDANVSSNIYTGKASSGTYAVKDSGDSVFSGVSMYSYSVDDANDMPDLVDSTGPQ